MAKTLILVLIAELWITLGQICFKKGSGALSFRSGVLWIGIAGMLAGMLFWFAALSSGDLNFVYLLGSVQYIFTLIAAHFFLKEKINRPKVIGTLLITLGIIFTVIS